VTSTGSQVLYIDDDAAFGRVVQRDLERHGYRVDFARDGIDGIRRLAAGPVDVIALDHYMPGQDGLATLSAIRRLPNPPPVVYVTGALDGRVAVAALKAGAADYVIKDVDGEFLVLLRAALEGALTRLNVQRAKEAAEMEVRAARDRFEALAAERAVLLREVNHRVGNSLQLIATLLHMQGEATGSQGIKVALGQASRRVLAVAQIHKRLYTSADIRSIALDQYLGALIEDLRKAHGSVSDGLLTFEAHPVEVAPDTAVAIGMIVTELVTNAQKHAYPGGRGVIRVALAGSGGRYLLSVEDEGVGRGQVRENSSGLGTLVVEAMTAKLGGTIDYESGGGGTRALLSFGAGKDGGG
jgi:two-component sensor histidine kinase